MSTPAVYAHIANNGYQAEVGLLTRNIVIQGAADDSEPTSTDDCEATGEWHHGTNFAVCPDQYTDVSTVLSDTLIAYFVHIS